MTSKLCRPELTGRCVLVAGLQGAPAFSRPPTICWLEKLPDIGRAGHRTRDTATCSHSASFPCSKKKQQLRFPQMWRSDEWWHKKAPGFNIHNLILKLCRKFFEHLMFEEDGECNMLQHLEKVHKYCSVCFKCILLQNKWYSVQCTNGNNVSNNISLPVILQSVLHIWSSSGEHKSDDWLWQMVK